MASVLLACIALCRDVLCGPSSTHADRLCVARDAGDGGAQARGGDAV